MPRAAHHRGRQATAAVLAALLLAAGQLAPAAAQAPAASPAADITPAERALFLEPSLDGLKPQSSIDYRFRSSGSLDTPFDDKVTLKLGALNEGKCCAATVDYLSGNRTVKLPPIDLVDANPVLLGFLEHDIREMERLTGGKANYFRKRIRLALADGPALQPRTLRYQGRDVAGVEISIAPYKDDPMRGRYDKLADKRYVFWRSAAVPGRLVGVRTVVPAGAGAAPLATTELWLQGSELPAAR